MLVERIIWTAIPAGFDAEGRLRLSVHVAPRLTTDDGDESERTLDEYGTFTNWAERVAGPEWGVEVAEQLGGPVVGHGASMESKVDADLWKVVFPGQTLVRPHAFRDHAKRNLHVFPVRDVLGFVEQTYAALSAAGPDLPPVADPKGPLAIFGALDGLTDRHADSKSFWEEIGRAQERAAGSELDDGKVVHESFANPSLPWDQQSAQAALAEATRFYYRPGSRRPDLPEDHVEPSPEVPRFDFHEIVSLLGDHPAILRRLGLVIDLVVELAEPLAELPAQGVVRLIPHGDLPEAPRSPWTRYDLDDRWFGARPNWDLRMERGLINLTREFWDLFQVDVDGAALKSVGFGGTLGAMLDPELVSHDTPTETGAPTLRSAGLALARQGRGDLLLEDLVQRRDKNAAIEAGNADHVELFAEDLVRGYRVDVWDHDAPSGARWHSLHERVTNHHVDNWDEPIVVEDEGFLKATSASSERKDHPAPSDDLYLHETVAAWEGWSLSAPRPGKRIVEPGEGDDGSSVARYDPTADQALAIRSEVAVAPGTLPRLRLGHTYRLRMRTVDLTGNSRTFSPDEYEDAQEELASEKQMYVRFEPVPSPTVLRRHLDTEGESLEHLVIRSDLGLSAAAYAASQDVKDALAEAGAPHAYSANSQRHVAAPKGSAQMAEQDSRFDAAFGGTAADMTAGLRLALREEGTFLDPQIVDPATGQKTIAQSTISLHPPGASLPTERGSGLGESDENLRGAYAFYPDADVRLPFLPDPLAIGAALIGYDRAGNELFYEFAPFDGDWPDPAPFRMRLSEGPISCQFSGGVLEITLPQAEVVLARLSSVFASDRLDDFAIWQWTPGPKRPALETPAVEARHWMLTPFRRVTFTHAVQRPLAVPDMTKVINVRTRGRTYAEFRGPILNHAKSTGRLDVLGAWTEDVDLLTDDAPRMTATGDAVPHSAHAFGYELEPDEDAAEVARADIERVARHEFGDTKYRRILYHSVATTRFREFLPRPIADDPERIQRVEADKVGGTPKPMLVHDVASSARPAAPDVSYALPTFRWEKSDEGPVRTHTRRGKAVRVWLRRPWFSSGDGEQLGIVLQPGVRLPGRWTRPAGVLELDPSRFTRRRSAIVSHRPLRPAMGRRDERAGRRGGGRADVFEPGPIILPPDIGSPPPTAGEIARMLQPYVTQWGSDPVWASKLPELPPTVADLPRHISYAAGLTLEELPQAARVVVAGHEVHYDADRKLWYCDIEIDAGDAYYPFVRLALARYQPHSVPDAHLSRVVMTDFIQVAPDRTAQVAPTRAGFAVTVRGYSGRNIVGDPYIPIVSKLEPSSGPNTEMRVELQQRPEGIPGDLGWERIGSEVTLSVKEAGWYVTWSGTIPAVSPSDGADLRLLITEIETHKRDLVPGDPNYSISPRDFVRERVVYADTFEL